MTDTDIAALVEWLRSPEFADVAEKYLMAEAADALEACQAELEEATDYAKRLAVVLWEKHWRDDAPEWQPLPDLIGILTQIDNATAGLVRAEKAERDELVREISPCGAKAAYEEITTLVERLRDDTLGTSWQLQLQAADALEACQAERDAAFEKYAEATRERDDARDESAKADDETRVLKLNIRKLELLGTQEEANTVYRLKARAEKAEARAASFEKSIDEFLAGCRRTALEEAARVADKTAAAIHVAAAIRALKENTNLERNPT